MRRICQRAELNALLFALVRPCTRWTVRLRRANMHRRMFLLFKAEKNPAGDLLADFSKNKINITLVHSGKKKPNATSNIYSNLADGSTQLFPDFDKQQALLHKRLLMSCSLIDKTGTISCLSAGTSWHDITWSLVLFSCFYFIAMQM